MSRVLVVDDDPAILKMVELTLVNAGHEVMTSDTPMGVSALVRRFTPHVLILDVMMPGLSGESLAKLIVRIAERRPVIFFSASPNEELLDLTRRVPDSTFVQKGESLKELIATVDKMARLYASQAP